jgi:prepilin-type N-terminal cleavage/methylation domain-containing protein
MKNKRGFSLIEFIMVITVLAVITSLAISLLVAIADAWVLHRQRRQMTEAGQIAIDRMAREIRRVRDRNSFTTAAVSSLRFTDIDNTDITFDLSGTTLRRTLGGVTINPLADNVSALTFTYYDSAGATLSAPVATPSNIRRIQVDITFTYSGSNFYLRSQVAPRRIQ